MKKREKKNLDGQIYTIKITLQEKRKNLSYFEDLDFLHNILFCP